MKFFFQPSIKLESIGRSLDPLRVIFWVRTRMYAFNGCWRDKTLSLFFFVTKTPSIQGRITFFFTCRKNSFKILFERYTAYSVKRKKRILLFHARHYHIEYNIRPNYNFGTNEIKLLEIKETRGLIFLSGQEAGLILQLIICDVVSIGCEQYFYNIKICKVSSKIIYKRRANPSHKSQHIQLHSHLPK